MVIYICMDNTLQWAQNISTVPSVIHIPALFPFHYPSYLRQQQGRTCSCLFCRSAITEYYSLFW